MIQKQFHIRHVKNNEIMLETEPEVVETAVEKVEPEEQPEIKDVPVIEEPQEEISYPLTVVYCGNCGLPPEYCEYFPDNERCRKWLEENLPNQFQSVGLGGPGGEEKSGRQKRGGKGLVKSKKPGKSGPKRVCVFRAPRGKKKSVTVITGLGASGIDLKVAAKYFSSRFSCGSSVTGDDEIVIQGDVKDDLFDVLPEKWPEIDEDCIDDLGDQKR